MKKIYLLLACFITTLLVQAQTTPSVNFAVTVNPGNNVNFANTSQNLGDGVKKAFWSFGDGAPVAVTGPYEGIVHHYAVAGTYQACLKIFRYNANNPADSVQIGAECKSLTIQQQCEAGFQWVDSTTSNAATHYVKFFGAAGNNANKAITEVCWTFGDGTDTCIQAAAGTVPPLNVVHKYAQPGTYTACIRVKFDGGCVAEKCNVVVLSGPAVADSCASAYTVQPITATPLGRKFIAKPWQSQGKKPVRICWTFGDGKDTCIQYATTFTGSYLVEHVYAQYGQYEVCATIKYDGGCEKRKCNVVSVSQPSTVDCSFDLNEAPVNVTSLERKFYVGLMPNRVAEKICWTFGDGTDTCITFSSPLNSQQLMVVHHYAAPGNYQVCAKVTYAGGCTVQRCRQVSINVPYNNLCGGYMTDSAVSANTVRFKGNGIQNPNDYVTAYNWTFGDGTTGSGQVVNHTYAAPGRYNVCLFIRTNLGCETRICKAVNVAGTNQPQLILTPNPVVNVLNATFHSLFQQTMTVKIYNANGIMVRSFVRNANVGVNNWTFSDVGTLPTGVYSVIVQSTNQFATAIFFKQ